jgi:hypothetical protein
MNCEEYREAIGADPSESFPGGPEHASGCTECSSYRQELLALDDCIARALAIDVPALSMPELPPVQAAGNVIGIGPAPVRRRPNLASPPLWAGLAAAVAVVALLVTGIPGRDTDRRQLAEQVMAHMDYEQSSRQVTSVPVSAQTLGTVVDPEVSAMDPDIGLITYAMSCVINGNTVPHLVVQGRQGPITLILLPEETIRKPIPLSGVNVHGVILPVGNGSIAVIGEREEQLGEIDEIGQRLAESVEWNI